MTRSATATAGQGILDRLRQAEGELAALRKELDHSHQLATLGTLTAGIAHEINNILTPVLAYAQLAAANPRDAALAAKAVKRTICGVESASRIIDAVLGFSRSDDSGEHADVAETVDASMACLARDPMRDGVRVVVDVPRATEVRIRPLALQQVLLNLILNAVNALHGRPGEVRISAEALEGAVTRIRVSDTGPGIPASVASRLFEPFVSGHAGAKQTATGFGGSGLGLAVCRRLVENAKGTIALDPSEPGSGASFTITLPTKAEDARDNAA